MVFQRKLLEALKCRVITRKVISKYVRLRKIGKRKKHSRYVGLCPFHKENTPSFTLYKHPNDPKEIWRFKCFGCGKSGDVIRFIMKYKGLEFVDSVNHILDIVRTGSTRGRFKDKNQLTISFPEDEQK